MTPEELRRRVDDDVGAPVEGPVEVRRGNGRVDDERHARGVGHVAALCRVAPPRIGVVLNVGTAHVGEFGSRAAIATAKSELVAALPPQSHDE